MFRSVNPYSQELITEYKPHSAAEVDAIISKANSAQKVWANKSVTERAQVVTKLSAAFDSNRQALAHLCALEMGKPISQGLQEVDKCSCAIKMLCEQAPEVLADRAVQTDATESFVRMDPLGIVLGIMPWNYPYWQVVRFMVPALLSGNAVLLKHASNVFGCAKEIERLAATAGLSEGLCSNLIISSNDVARVIENPAVKAVTLTGSEKAGLSVAGVAGRNLKPVILELGGNNAFVVMADADIEQAVKDAIVGRFQNSGQSCIAAKRILLDEKIEKQFLDHFAARVKQLWVGDPTDNQCFIGPLARKDLAEELHDQVERSISAGAKLLVGGRFSGATYSPTILTDVKPGMAAFEEETFGPVASISTFSNQQEAIDLINQSSFGLGVSLYTSDLEKAKALISQLDEGAVFINSIVKSDPRLPFGGVKNSGFGRELGEEGLLAFVNRKTVYIQ